MYKILAVLTFILLAATSSYAGIFDPGGFARMESVTAFPTSPYTGQVVVVTDDSVAGACDSGAGVEVTLCYYNGSDWIPLGAGALSEADTLDSVFDRGKTIDGANSLANAFCVGDDTNKTCIYTDSVQGQIVEPSPAANVRQRIPVNKTGGVRDVEGDCDVEEIDPDAATSLAAWTYSCTNTRPKKSVWLDAGAASTDGTNCGVPTESANTLVKTWTIVCADNDSSKIYWKLGMPDSWDGGTVTFELQVYQTAASTNAIQVDFAAMCYSHDEAVSAFGSPPTGEQPADITLTSANDILHGTTAAVTVAGTTCAGGDTLFVTGQVDATASHADIATKMEIMGVKMEYTITSRSD